MNTLRLSAIKLRDNAAWRLAVMCSLLSLSVAVAFGQPGGNVSLSNRQVEFAELTSAEPMAEVTFDVESAVNVTISVTASEPGVLISVEGPQGQLVTPADVELLAVLRGDSQLRAVLLGLLC